MSAHIYLDESGDTGWILDKPYTKGGSSRYLLIAACIVSPEKDHKPERILRQIYKHRKWNPGSEKKWARMSPDARTAFAKDAGKLANLNSDITYHVIVVDKRNVQQHIRQDSNKLYNYMVKMLLLDSMSTHDVVYFFPDPRSIKVESGNSLHDYLQTELWFNLEVQTRLETTLRDSRNCLNLQFVDMIAGVAQSFFEFGYVRHWDYLREYVKLKTLFFT
jgi:hypothetical protein